MKPSISSPSLFFWRLTNPVLLVFPSMSSASALCRAWCNMPMMSLCWGTPKWTEQPVVSQVWVTKKQSCILICWLHSSWCTSLVWGWYHWPKGQIYVQFVANRTPKDFSARAVLVQLTSVCLVAEGYSIPAAGFYICLCGMYEVPISQFLQPLKVILKRSSPASQPLLHGLVSSTNLLRVYFIPSSRLLLKTLSSISPVPLPQGYQQ